MHHSHMHPRQYGRWIPVGMTFWLILALVSQGRGQTEARQNRTRSNPRRTEPQVYVQLPQPESIGSMTLERALQKSSTLEAMSPQALTGSALGQLAWSAVSALDSLNLVEQWLLGENDSEEIIDLYIVTYEGLFQYTRHGHRLQQLAMGDTRTLLTLPPDGMGSPINHGAAFIIANQQRRIQGRRGEMQQRQTLIKAGQIAQTMRLQAASMGLASLPLEPLDARHIREVLELSRTVTPLYVLLVGYRPNQMTDPQLPRTPVQPTQPTQGKPVILVVPPENFQDQELQQTQQALSNAGVNSKIASTRLGPIHGILGQTAYATVLLDQVKVDEIQGLIVIGGPGALQLVENQEVQSLARETMGRGKVIGAISTGVRVLAEGGVLKQVRVTGHPSDQQRLTEAGAIFTNQEVTQDRLVITASGPSAAGLFGRTLATTLKAQP